MRHPIQCRRFEEEFRGLLRELPRVQSWAKEGLEAKEGGFRQAAPMVPRLLFPAAPAVATDRPQVLIPLLGRRGTVAMVPDLGVPARGDRGLGPAFLNRLVAAPLVIGPVGTDLTHLALYPRQQVGQGCVIGHPGFT